MLIDYPVLSASDHALSRAQTQLVPCVYIALRCQHCGELRQALASAPLEENVSCPVCSATCNFQLLGGGLTTSQLPFHELYPPEQTRWITHDSDNDAPNNDDPDALTPAAHSADARNAEARSAQGNEPQTLDGS